MKTRVVIAGVIAAVLVLGGTATGDPVDDQAPIVLSGAAAQFYGYATPVMTVERGGELDYANFDIVQHDVVQDVKVDGVANKKKSMWCENFDKGECPLFWSARAGLGDTVSVKGLRNVKAGKVYTFFCTLHPGMKGKLVVR